MTEQIVNIMIKDPRALLLEVKKTENRRFFEVLRNVSPSRAGACYRGYSDFALFGIYVNEGIARSMFTKAVSKYYYEHKKSGKIEVLKSRKHVVNQISI